MSPKLLRTPNMGRMFPDSPAPVFWLSGMALLADEWKVEPVTASRFLRAAVANLWRLNLYRWRWLLWRIGFVDIGAGETWPARRWRWRWWRPRTGETPQAEPVRWEAWAWAMSPLWFLAPLIYAMHLISIAMGWQGL